MDLTIESLPAEQKAYLNSLDDWLIAIYECSPKIFGALKLEGNGHDPDTCFKADQIIGRRADKILREKRATDENVGLLARLSIVEDIEMTIKHRLRPDLAQNDVYTTSARLSIIFSMQNKITTELSPNAKAQWEKIFETQGSIKKAVKSPNYFSTQSILLEAGAMMSVLRDDYEAILGGEQPELITGLLRGDSIPVDVPIVVYA